jgi:S-adenosylmethionine decarboxylase
MVGTYGKHLLVEYAGCNSETLNSVEEIQALMERAAKAARTTVVTSAFQPFEPQGVSGVVVISESHLSIHTWPENGYAAVDFYTCGQGDPYAAHEVLKQGLRALTFEVVEVARGGLSGGPMMHVEGPTRDGLPFQKRRPTLKVHRAFS